MNLIERDIVILEKIIKYCDEIKHAISRFGDSIDAIRTDVEYKNAVAMDILQIGELTTHLSDGFKNSYPDQPWKDINGMRNIAAHHYGELDIDILWKTIKSRVPELREYCVQCVAELQSERSPASPRHGPVERAPVSLYNIMM
jgi:uncharacterized protein with HEPN domain